MPMDSSTEISNRKTSSYQYSLRNPQVPPASCIHPHRPPRQNNLHHRTLSNSPILGWQEKSGLVHPIHPTFPPDGTEHLKSFSEQRNILHRSISGQWEPWPLKLRRFVLFFLGQMRLISFGGFARSWARQRIGMARRSGRGERSRSAEDHGLTAYDLLTRYSSSFQRYSYRLALVLTDCRSRPSRWVRF